MTTSAEVLELTTSWAGRRQSQGHDLLCDGGAVDGCQGMRAPEIEIRVVLISTRDAFNSRKVEA